MDYPKISIVTPNYNQGEYLEKTILSVLNQNYPNLEYIILDAGSTDNSINILKKYEDKITSWESAKDEGMYDAINKGLSRCTGDILAWINSDDIYLNGAFKTVSQIFTDFKEVQWLTANPLCINEYGDIVDSHNAITCSKYDYLTGSIKWIQQESTFWRRSLWEKVKQIDLNYKLAGDYFLWTKFFEHSPVYTVRTNLAAFRFRTKNQKTLDCRDGYMQELNDIRNKASFTDQEIKALKEYTQIRKLLKIPGASRISYLRGENSRLERVLFKSPKRFLYNRLSEKFELHG